MRIKTTRSISKRLEAGKNESSKSIKGYESLDKVFSTVGGAGRIITGDVGGRGGGRERGHREGEWHDSRVFRRCRRPDVRGRWDHRADRGDPGLPEDGRTRSRYGQGGRGLVFCLCVPGRRGDGDQEFFWTDLKCS